MRALGAALSLTMVSLAACGASPSFATASSLPAEPRIADGVTLDVPLDLPPARDRAGDGRVAVLRQPLSDAALVATLAHFFDAMVAEDPASLARVLDATASYRAGNARSAAKLLEVLRSRMQRMDYGRLAGVDFARLEALDRRVPADAEPDGEVGELEVRVPITTARFGGERLFGDVAIFVVRADSSGRPLIIGYGDDVGP